ncbi:melanoma inhibitory activity protein 2 isoform X2 [Leucoraja erinacea]|uniref:melanoma inhibitory activity protein 2 isoform X2 n=1 Tax=Leucoraja erinaceus TaxID=7782 RepID=UPI002456B4B6|nr:melanoma inhibitory activity protein 2 isoform X2 [Leucoraja erinacea]
MASAAVLSTLLLLFLRLKPSEMISKLSDLKVCGDPECARYLSRVTATLDYTGRDCRFLTFRHGDSIFVYFKLTGKRDDLWAGSMGKQFGYFPKDAVKVEDVMAYTEVELPTQESDFLCLDEENYIDNEEIDSVINDYGENSFSMPDERKLGHEPKPNEYNQVYEGNSAKRGPMDNLIDLNKTLVQRTHHAAKLEKNSDKDHLAKSLAHDENVQVNEFLSPTEHQNDLSDESVSRQTDNEFDLVNLPDTVQSKYIGFENDEHPGQEISENSKAVPEESNWIGSRISGWFGVGSNENEKVVEPTDEPMQLNSFISRKIPLDYEEKTVLSEEENNNMYSEDRGVLGLGMSSWSEGLSKLLNFNSDLPEDVLSTNEGEKKHQNAKLYLDDSTDPSNIFVAESGNKISEHSVADDSRLKYSQSENIDTDEKNVMGHVISLFGLSDKLWFGQTNKAKNSDMTESTREENSNDNDKSESWWPNLNVVNDIFRFGGDNGDQTGRTLETQTAGGNEKNSGETGESNSPFSQGNENQVPSLPDENDAAINENSKEMTLDVDGSVSGRASFGLKDILIYGQTDEDLFVSSPPEELTKSIFRDEKQNTMNSESEEGSPMLKLVTSRVASIADSIKNEDANQSPKQCLDVMESDVTCQSEYLQQSEKEYRETENEIAQSITGLKNNLESKTSKLEELLEQNVIQDSDFINPNMLLTQEHLHEDLSLQEHLIYISKNDQSISDYTKTENLHSGEKVGEQGDLQNQDLASEVEQITIVSEHDHSASDSLSEEDKYLTMHSEWALNKEPGSETAIITAADNADHSAWDKLQVEGEILQDNQCLPEEKIHRKQQMRQQEDVIPALESEQFNVSDAFSTDDNLGTGVASKEILDKTIQMSKHGQEQMETIDLGVTEKGKLDLVVKITDSDNMAAEAVVEHKFGNQLQKESWDLRNEEPGHYQTEEKTTSSLSSGDIKKPLATDDPKAETWTDDDIEYETSVQEAAGHILGSIVDVVLQNFIIIVDHFKLNSNQTVMDILSEDPGASTILRGPRTELFLISFLLGIITALLFIYRTCQAVKSRRYLEREKQLAETVAQLIEAKCKLLEKLSNCKQKYSEFEASVEEAAVLKQSTETKTLHLQETYAKLEQSNHTLRQSIDQFTQDLEREKQTRSQQSNLITEIRGNLIALENEDQNLKTQVEEAKKELKEIQVNDTRFQEFIQAEKEENYHLKESNKQLFQESEGWNERYSELTEHINLSVKSQKDIREVLACKDNEIKSLTDCLLKMKLWSVTEDNPSEEIPEEQQKQKIENLIYVAKLNASLKSVEEERNQIHGKLSDEINAKQELMERIEKLQLDHTSIKSVKSQFETEHKTIQQKLKIMTELYHEKEMELQRNLTLEEHQRLQKEEKLSEVDGRINQATEELTIYRQRAKDLEEELMKTMQSYKNQIVSHEKKAHDNWLSAREAERENGNIKRENIHLRQKITEAEFKIDIVLKDPLVIDVSGRPGLSASTFVPPYRGGSSPYGPSPVGRPGADPMGFLSPPLLDGPLRFSPLFPGKPDSKTRGPSVQLDHTANESTDSVSDRLSDHHGPQSDSGSLSPVWERDRKLFRTPPALICADGRPKQENSMQSSNSASESQAQDQDTINALLNPSLLVEADLGIRPGFAPAYLNQVPSLHVDLRGHVPLRGLPPAPRGGIYGPLERFPLRAFGLPPHPSLEIRPGLYFPPPRPMFLPHRPFSNIAGGLLPTRLPLPNLPSTERPSSQDNE